MNNNLSDNALIPVRNMVNHKVVYKIPDQNRRIEFEPFQERKITAGELRALHYTSGGETLLHEFLCVKNDILRDVLLDRKIPQEYFDIIYNGDK